VSRPRRRYGVMTERWGWQPFCWEEAGLPTWRPRQAPAGLLTRRQMREAGLAPGGAEPVAQLLFSYRRREVRALLWDRSELVAKRVPSPAQVEALGRAMAARRWCPSCRRDVGYCVPTSLGECIGCAYPDAEPLVVAAFHDLTEEVARDAA
jgi:hypothetical protein